MTREIPLTKGLAALVDDENFEWLSQWTWHTSDGYAVRRAANGTKASGGTVGMHRVVAGAGPGEVVDHINRNPLDNRRANLRVCIQRDNSRNRRGWLTGRSAFKGVSFDRERSIWVANISVNRRTVFIGRFDQEPDAAAAYDAAAVYAFREFALCNFPEGGERPISADLAARLDAAARGERKPKASVTAEVRAAALARALRGEDYRFIAEDVGLSRSAIAGIVFRNKRRAEQQLAA